MTRNQGRPTTKRDRPARSERGGPRVRGGGALLTRAWWLWLATLALAGGLVASWASWQGPSRDSLAAAAEPGALPSAQPVLGLPLSGVRLAGASPATGEVWGYAGAGGTFQIVRYVRSSGWQLQAQSLDAEGAPLADFTPAPGPQAARTTTAGGVAILGEDAAKAQGLLVRAPGGNGSFREAPALAPESEPARPNALLRPGETLLPVTGDRSLMAAIEQPDGHTGVFVVPYEGSAGTQESVLFYDGSEQGSAWTREPICAGTGPGSETCGKPTTSFKVLGVGASSGENAWLLATGGASGEAIELFERTGTGSSVRWIQRTLGGSLGMQFSKTSLSFAAGTTVKVAALGNGQPLTVTAQGLWVDGQLTVSGQAEPSDFTLYFRPETSGGGSVLASWCKLPEAAASLCSYPLESQLPSGDYRSFAWSGGGPFGQRVITGLDAGVSLYLQGTDFTRVLGVGGDAGTSAGAAFASVQEGWLANAAGGPLTHLTSEPAPDRLQSWPVPFRRPLTAIAAQPGATPGETDAQAIAVGESGQVAHYLPGQGWTPEALLSSTGVAQTPDLRGVAWPEPARAYAVGTHGAMWLWQSSTGLWEPDPARPPNLFLDNFTGIAFDPSEPARGYAIGQQGVLLGYNKTWTQEPLPPGLERADFTSIAFAGNEALVTYQIPHFNPNEGYGYGFSGGLLVNNGGGWSIETAADEALGVHRVPERVAGLPDGGAIVAANGAVAERQSPSAPWQPAPAGGIQGQPVALAAFREDGQLHAAVSVGTASSISNEYAIDRALEQTPPEDQAPVATEPFPLPINGFLLRETASGWEDEEHEDFPTPNNTTTLPSGETGLDWPDQPDAVLAMALDPEDGQGWAIGGQTGEVNNEGLGEVQQHIEAIQTAGVMRYPASSAPPAGFSVSPETTDPGNPSFAIGGNAQCATACADLTNTQIGPDEWLSNAITRSSQMPVRAFLYTGSHVASGLGDGGFGATSFVREEDRYSEVLKGGTGPLKTFAAPSESDLDGGGTLATFAAAMGSVAPVGSVPSGQQPPGNTGAYAYNSTGRGGNVKVVVLDYSHPALGEAQQCWLAQQLAQAKHEGMPSIVLGNRGLGSGSASVGHTASDANQVIPTLVSGTPPPTCVSTLPAGGASAYFYDSPEQNRVLTISSRGESIQEYGSGTLGYVNPPARTQLEFVGASGFLVAEVEAAKRETNAGGKSRAPVHVRLVPDISDLAVNATNGVLLRRSQAALFKGLARRPHAGMVCQKASASCRFLPDPYVPIPTLCQGTGCASAIFPEYTFSSSDPDVGDFVEPDPASPEGSTVLQSANGKPIPDVHSGLFCAYNAGTTTITLHAGGLSASMPVTILSGSVEQPCGTTPLRHPPTPVREAGLPAPLPAPAPTPTPAPNGALPPPPPAPVLVAPPPRTPPSHRAPINLLPLPAAQLFPLVPLVPPAAPSAARPTPPSGTAQVPAQSPVSQQVTVAEREEEEQRATETVHHMVAYRHDEEAPLPAWTLALILLAAIGGLGLHRGSRAPARVYLRQNR